MRQNKNTKTIGQINNLSKTTEQLTQNISDVIDKFRLKSIFGEFDSVKLSGGVHLQDKMDNRSVF